METSRGSLTGRRDSKCNDPEVHIVLDIFQEQKGWITAPEWRKDRLVFVLISHKDPDLITQTEMGSH